MREQAVAELASTGSPSRGIAGSLNLSVRTVEHHLSAVYRKLGVRSRAELAARFAHGLTPERPSTHYARSHHGHIAYQVHGDGGHDVVLVPGFVSNVETAWEWPAHAYFLDRLARDRRLITFDKRGTGLSDPVARPSEVTLDDRMDDIRAVLDAVHSKRATLFAYSEGAALAMLFAGVYPERTNGLILYAPLISADLNRDVTPMPMGEETRHRVQAAWGSGRVLARAAPSVAGTAEGLAHIGRFERHGASPSGALDILMAVAAVEARDLSAAVQVPTLVLHRRGDPFVSVRNSHYLATALHDVDYIELEGADHPPWVGDTDTVLRHSDEFLTREHHPSAQSRNVLSTIVRTEPPLAPAQLPLVQRHQGRTSGTPGGIGYFFDSPRRALDFAFAVHHAHPTVRVAVHTGDITLAPTGAEGPAIDATEHILRTCDPGNIVISNTVRELLGPSISTAPTPTTLSIDNHPWSLFHAHPHASSPTTPTPASTTTPHQH